MKKFTFLSGCLSVLMVVIFFLPLSVKSAEPIIMGVCTDLETAEGKEEKIAAEIAVDEINAKGGVMVGGEKRQLKLVASSSRDMQPGIPISEALMAYEKLLLQNKPVAMVPGLFSSEFSLASMDLLIWSLIK